MGERRTAPPREREALEAPRWEYRAFASAADLGPVERAIRERGTGGGVLELQDTYLIPPGGRATNVKIRKGNLKIKRRLAVDRHVERWDTTAYEPFPLTREFLCRHRLHDPEDGFGEAWLDGDRFETPEDLVRALSRPFLETLVVGVFKRRLPYGLGGCTAEIVDLLVAGQPVRSICVEAGHLEPVIETVDAIGLAQHPNRSYPEAIRRTVAVLAARS